MSVESFLPIAYFQHQFIPFADANLSIATHALHYGTGAIAGLRGIPNPENVGGEIRICANRTLMLAVSNYSIKGSPPLAPNHCKKFGAVDLRAIISGELNPGTDSK